MNLRNTFSPMKHHSASDSQQIDDDRFVAIALFTTVTGYAILIHGVRTMLGALILGK